MYEEIDGEIVYTPQETEVPQESSSPEPPQTSQEPLESPEATIQPAESTEAPEASETPSEASEAPAPVQPISVVDYDDLVEALASVSTPAIYPSSTAVQVFGYALDSYKDYRYYAIVPGSSASDVYMYTADDYTLSGSTVTLTGDVTAHRYYTYRPSTSSTTQYLYTVTSSPEVSFSLGSTLVYTNTVEGYPDIYTQEQHNQPTYVKWFLILGFVIFILMLFRRYKDD